MHFESLESQQLAGRNDLVALVVDGKEEWEGLLLIIIGEMLEH